MSTPAQLGLEAALAAAGSQSELARRCKVSRQAVSGWVKRGKVPPEFVPCVAEATGVPDWQLAPDIFWPGPYGLRKSGL